MRTRGVTVRLGPPFGTVFAGSLTPGAPMEVDSWVVEGGYEVQVLWALQVQAP